jgi:aminoglycoside phosphotransferase (APT) family kinase protein
MDITLSLAKTLLDASDFEHKHLPLVAVQEQGHDHRTFICGSNYSMRIPSADYYVAQIMKEAEYLPFLASHLTLEIPKPVYVQDVTRFFHRPWIIHQWIDGTTAQRDKIQDINTFIHDLSMFILEFQQIDTRLGPKPGQHNFYRGAHPKVYHQEVMQALAKLREDVHHNVYLHIWQQALASSYPSSNVWIHGDLELSNLLVRDGQLCAVIDFGNMAVGDPACDYVMAWTFMTRNERAYFFKLLALDEALIQRAKAWALWKALITITNPNASSKYAQAQMTLQALLDLR